MYKGKPWGSPYTGDKHADDNVKNLQDSIDQVPEDSIDLLNDNAFLSLLIADKFEGDDFIMIDR